MKVRAVLFFFIHALVFPTTARSLSCKDSNFVVDTTVVYAIDTSLSIQRISIKNVLIENYLKQFIDKTKLNNKLFQDDFGYIELSNTQIYKKQPINTSEELISKDWQSDTLFSFRISLSSRVLLDESESDAFLSDYYPAFYAIIENCPVLIYENITDVYMPIPCKFCYKSPFSILSKRKLQEIINYRLKKALEPNFTFVTIEGKNFTLTTLQRATFSVKDILKKAVFLLNKSYQVYILRNGTFIEHKL